MEQVEVQIAKVKEEAFNRKEILEKVEKWLAACEEESWLRNTTGLGILTLHLHKLSKISINNLKRLRNFY